MRITAGHLRGRNLPVPDIAGLRPTPSRVREAIFNILGSVEDYHVLDLFAGSGVMALEALSRGAASAVSIEQHGKAIAAMKKAAAMCACETEWTLRKGKLPQALQSFEGQAFDLIFADPPYDKGIAEQIPAWLDAHGITTRHLMIEEAARAEPVWPKGWTPLSCRRYGDTCLYIFDTE
jgi:16S rRNA (guanine966-N2)-methyltransferase